LTARELESHGIATVIIGSGLDIVEKCGVPRYLHNDIPLGNPLGHPYAAAEQLASVASALQLIEQASVPTIRFCKVKWHDGEGWRANYMKIDETNRETLRLAGIENRRSRREQIEKGEKR
jgi:D-proline reductase (dithiol) PrdB